PRSLSFLRRSRGTDCGTFPCETPPRPVPEAGAPREQQCSHSHLNVAREEIPASPRTCKAPTVPVLSGTAERRAARGRPLRGEEGCDHSAPRTAHCAP